MVEYGLIIGLVSVLLIGALMLLSSSEGLGSLYNSIAEGIASAASGS